MVVSRQMQRGPGRTVELRAPKHGSERTIVVPDRLLTLIAGHVERHLPAGGPERWLVPNPTGAPPHQNTVGHQWRKAMSAAGPTGLRLHDARHFFVSGLIGSGLIASGDAEHLRAPVARMRRTAPGPSRTA